MTQVPAGPLPIGSAVEGHGSSHHPKGQDPIDGYTTSEDFDAVEARVDTAESDIDTLQGQVAFTDHKTADQAAVNNSTTLVNSTELAVPVTASTSYAVTWTILYDSAAAADIKFGWTVPSGTKLYWQAILPQAGATNWQSGDETSTPTAEGFGGIAVITIVGTIIASSTPGAVQLQHAQLTANASNTVVKAGSSVVAQKLST